MTLHVGTLQTGTYMCAHTVHKIMQHTHAQGTLNTHHTHRHPAHTSTLHAFACTSATDTWRPQHQGSHTRYITHICICTHVYTNTGLQCTNTHTYADIQTCSHAHTWQTCTSTHTTGAGEVPRASLPLPLTALE